MRRRMRARDGAERRWRALVRAASLLAAGALALLIAEAIVGARGIGAEALGPAVAGSLLTAAVALAVALPVGVLAALQLEEFAPAGRARSLLGAALAQLSATPPLLVGVLGFVLVAAAGLPRGAPLSAGLVLGMTAAPTIAGSGRLALRAIPGSVREGARALGASPVQVAFHHLLPAALPRLLTGMAAALAQALGEAAPVLLVGVGAAATTGLLAPGTTLAVLVYRTSAAAALVLLGLVALAHAAAALLRRRETRP